MNDTHDAGKLGDVLSDYRKTLVAAEQKAQEDFDKTVLSLSGGGLGVSFVFLKDIIGVERVVSPGWLFGAWSAWGLSTLLVLASFHFSHRALRRACEQVDAGTIYGGRVGGRWASATEALNASGAILFVLGVISITVFSGLNLKQKGELYARKEVTSTSATIATAPPSPHPTGTSTGGRSGGEDSGRLGSAASANTPTSSSR